GFRRALDVDQHKSLVFVRQERGRKLQEGPAEADEERQVDDHEAAGAVDDIAYGRSVACRCPVEATVEPAEESLLLVMMALGYRLQEAGAERRCQRQGKEAREQDRHDHGQAELL